MEVENRPPTEEELTIIDIELKVIKLYFYLAFNELLSRSIYMILSVPYPQVQLFNSCFCVCVCKSILLREYVFYLS